MDDLNTDILVSKFLNNATLQELYDEIKPSISSRQMYCAIHGTCEHSYCSLSGHGICIECIKKRRFRIVGKNERNHN